MSTYHPYGMVNEANSYITNSNHVAMVRLYQAVREESERKIEAYKDFLTESEMSYAI